MYCVNLAHNILKKEFDKTNIGAILKLDKGEIMSLFSTKAVSLLKIRELAEEHGHMVFDQFEFWMQEATAREEGVSGLAIGLILQVGLDNHRICTQ